MVHSRAELTQLVSQYLEAESHTLVYNIRMHYKLTAKEFSQTAIRIMETLQEARKADIKAKALVFIDELNATSIMGLLKEVFVDRTLNGQPLPPNLLWVGSMNPNIITGMFKDAPIFRHIYHLIR